MKYRFYALFALSCLIVGPGCSDKFEVAAPYKNITFTYAAFDMKDTAHYIRVQKAFLDDNKSAIQMASVPDSSFYTNLSVLVRELSGTTVIKTIQTTRVDLNNEGIPKESGDFFTSPSWAYKFKAPLDPSRQYRVVVSAPNAGVADSAQVAILDASKFIVSYFQDGNYNIRFRQTLPKGTIATTWRFDSYIPSNSALGEMYLRFHYEERNGTTSSNKSVQVTIPYNPDKSAASTFSFTADNLDLYNALRNTMGVAPSGVTRYMDSIDVSVYVADANLKAYRDAQNAGSGLTGDQIKPVFSSFTGRDFYGLLCSRAYIEKKGIPLDPATLDSLMINPVTAPLQIKGFSQK